MKTKSLGVLAAVGAVTVVVLLSAASGGATGSGIFASVFATNAGPVHACTAPPCPLDTVTQFIIYTVNANRPVNWGTMQVTRSDVPNAYAVSSIEGTISINGVVQPGVFTPTPPPAASPPGFAGRWPVSCAPFSGTFSSPCNVTSPAVLPGEITAPFISRWIHGADEQDGTYVFTFTIHGTVNGAPVDVSASSKPIVMTR